MPQPEALTTILKIPLDTMYFVWYIMVVVLVYLNSVFDTCQKAMSDWDGETPNLVPTTSGGYPYVPPYQTAPGIQYEYQQALYMRDVSFRAYIKALKAGKEYTTGGMNLKRYDIAALRAEYIFWRDQVDTIARHGNSSTMVWKHIIPYF